MTDYFINGSAASLEPISQQWVDIPISQNIQGRTIYYPRKEVILTFDSASMPLYHQWANVANAGSIISITMLDNSSLAYSTYNNVYLSLDDRPVFEGGAALGPWSIKVRETDIDGSINAGYMLNQDGSFVLQEDGVGRIRIGPF